MHGFMYPATVGDEPVVDAAQRRQHAALYPGLFGDFPDRGLFRGLAELDVAFGKRPQHPAASVDAADQCRDLLFTGAINVVDDQSTGRRLVHGPQPLGSAACRAALRGLRWSGRCGAGHGLVAGLGLARPCRAPTAAPPAAPTRLRFFAVGHPSDSSWRAQTLWPHSPVVSCTIGSRFPDYAQIVGLLSGHGAPHRRPTTPRLSDSSAATGRRIVVRLRPDCRTPQRPRGAASSSDYALSRAR